MRHFNEEMTALSSKEKKEYAARNTSGPIITEDRLNADLRNDSEPVSAQKEKLHKKVVYREYRKTTGNVGKRISDTTSKETESTIPFITSANQKRLVKKKQAAKYRKDALVKDGVVGSVNSEVNRNNDDNSAVDAANTGLATEHRLRVGTRKQRLKYQATESNHNGSFRVVKGLGKKKSKLQIQQDVQNTVQASGYASFQKALYRKRYARAFRENELGAVIPVQPGIRYRIRKAFKTIFRRRKSFEIIAVCVAMAILFGIACFSVAGDVVTSLGNSVISSTYLSSDDDIYQANDYYTSLERKLQQKVDSVKQDYPGYDSYRFQVDEITHDPYALTSYLTAQYQEYHFEEIKPALEDLFKRQFVLNIYDSKEIEKAEDGNEKEVHILNAVVINRGIDWIARQDLEGETLALYKGYQSCYGNRSYLFGELVAGNPSSGGMSYEIPPEALSDEKFANMIHEAEKYLGYPYVWGGSSPETSFDCSGFVCWVVNHCGNGWNVGRTTAEGLRNMCTYVSPDEARPGDLVFFEHTYDTPGASHIAIYVGNQMFIHCGDPIQYSSLTLQYWQDHFMCFGRLP